MNPRLKTSPDSTSGPNLRPGTPPPPTARPTQTAPAPHTLKPLHTARPTGHRSTDPTPLSPPHTAHPTAHCLTTTHARPPHTARPTQIARLGKKSGKIHTHTPTPAKARFTPQQAEDSLGVSTVDRNRFWNPIESTSLYHFGKARLQASNPPPARHSIHKRCLMWSMQLP
jgi:hypothetical protein